MDVIHEWKIDRFGKLDWQPKSGWVVNETPDMSLKILSSRKLVISSSNVIVVSIIIIPWSSWIVIVASCFKHISIKYKCAICMPRIPTTGHNHMVANTQLGSTN